jgi:hypothetical protein
MDSARKLAHQLPPSRAQHLTNADFGGPPAGLGRCQVYVGNQGDEQQQQAHCPEQVYVGEAAGFGQVNARPAA